MAFLVTIPPIWFYLFQAGLPSDVAKTSLGLRILSPQQYWGYRCVSPHLALIFALKVIVQTKNLGGQACFSEPQTQQPTQSAPNSHGTL